MPSQTLERHSLDTARKGAGEIALQKTITIAKGVSEVHDAWRAFETFPQFMRNVLSVESSGLNMYHWALKGPANKKIEWDAEIFEDDARRISWRTVGVNDIDHAGSVEFEEASAGRGTELRVRIVYHPPFGKAGDAASKMLGADAFEKLKEDLYRFRQFMETGEIATPMMNPGRKP